MHDAARLFRSIVVRSQATTPSYPVFRHSIERGQTIVILLDVLTVFINNKMHISDNTGQQYVRQHVQCHSKRFMINIFSINIQQVITVEGNIYYTQESV